MSGNDIKALEHLEEISNNLDDIRKELGSVSSSLWDIDKYLIEIAINTQEKELLNYSRSIKTPS